MPDKNNSSITDQPCRRCGENAAILIVRKDPLCRQCFIRYVHTKAIKRLESFRVRNASPDHQRQLLLPLSFGVSSVTLLHILDHQLKTQMSKTGRAGFALRVLFVDTESIETAPLYQDLFAKAQEAYPTYEFASLPLDHIFDLVAAEDDLFTLLPTSMPKDSSSGDKLEQLLASLNSATARADVVSTLRTKLIVEHAKSTGCEGVLWGDSTTKLAEKTLAETAKGRGFSLPWQVADGESPFGLTFNYPLRDLLKKELVSYTDINGPPLSTIVRESLPTQASISSKNTTIDDLMKQYFESVEENFPSIVSNVVRTTGKLEATPVSGLTPICSLCSMPVSDSRFGISGWGGDQQTSAEDAGRKTARLCYGCTRSMPHPTTVTATDRNG